MFVNAIPHLLGIAIASNLDNLAVGVSYGVRGIELPPLPNLVISAIAFALTYLAASLGVSVAQFMTDRAAVVAGAMLMIGLGIWVMPAGKPRRRLSSGASSRPSVFRILAEPELADLDRSGTISVFESLFLGLAVSLNCFTNGLSAGLWKLGVPEVALCNAVLSYLSLWFGSWLGRRYGAHWLGRTSPVFAGWLLILLGACQLMA